MDMRIYRAPDGRRYRYREGHAPDGYVLVDEPKTAPKRTPAKQRTAANKARKTTTK